MKLGAINIRMKLEEKEIFKAGAEREILTMSTWMRMIELRSAEASMAHLPVQVTVETSWK